MLDTCEHVVGAAAQLASAALRTAPGVRVLATSRRPLGVSGEFTWPVPPLDLPPPDAVVADDITSHAAVALFVERATAVPPDLEVDDTAAADIAAVCIALDGLPLAIELAAARTDVLSPAAVRSRLEDRFGLLVDGGTDVAESSRRCRAAIDWSFELLSPPQRTFFARLDRVRRHLQPRCRVDRRRPGSRRATRVAGVARKAVDGGPIRTRSLPAAGHVACVRPGTPR